MSEFDELYFPGCGTMWDAVRARVDVRASRRDWFDARFENVRVKADRIHAREQLIAEVFGWAEPC